MTKLEAMGLSMELIEALKKLPSNAEVAGCSMGTTIKDNRLTPEIHIQLSERPDMYGQVLTGCVFEAWTEKRIELTPYAYCWWREDHDAS